MKLPDCKVTTESAVDQHHKSILKSWPKARSHLKRALSSNEMKSLEEFVIELSKLRNRDQLLEFLTPCTWWVLDKTLDRWVVQEKLSPVKKDKRRLSEAEETSPSSSKAPPKKDSEDSDKDNSKEIPTRDKTTPDKEGEKQKKFDYSNPRVVNFLGKYLAYFILSVLLQRITKEPGFFLKDKSAQEQEQKIKNRMRQTYKGLLYLHKKLHSLKVPIPQFSDKQFPDYSRIDWEEAYKKFQPWLQQLQQDPAWPRIVDRLNDEWKKITVDFQRVKLGDDIVQLDLPSDLNLQDQVFFYTLKQVIDVAYKHYEELQKILNVLKKQSEEVPQKNVNLEGDEEASEESEQQKQITFLSRNIAVLLSAIGTLELLGKMFKVGFRARSARQWSSVNRFLSRNLLWNLDSSRGFEWGYEILSLIS